MCARAGTNRHRVLRVVGHGARSIRTAWIDRLGRLTDPDRPISPRRYMTPDDSIDGHGIIHLLRQQYGVSIRTDFGWTPGGAWREGNWSLAELRTVERAIGDLAAAMGGEEPLTGRLGTVRLLKGLALGFRGLTWCAGLIGLADDPDEWTLVHELAHSWDYSTRQSLSKALQRAVGASDIPLGDIRRRLSPRDTRLWYDPGASPPPCGVDAAFNRAEDWAESVTAAVYPDEAKRRAAERGWPYTAPDGRYDYAGFAVTPRGCFVTGIMAGTDS